MASKSDLMKRVAALVIGAAKSSTARKLRGKISLATRLDDLGLSASGLYARVRKSRSYLAPGIAFKPLKPDALKRAKTLRDLTEAVTEASYVAKTASGSKKAAKRPAKKAAKKAKRARKAKRAKKPKSAVRKTARKTYKEAKKAKSSRGGRSRSTIRHIGGGGGSRGGGGFGGGGARKAKKPKLLRGGAARPGGTRTAKKPGVGGSSGRRLIKPIKKREAPIAFPSPGGDGWPSKSRSSHGGPAFHGGAKKAIKRAGKGESAGTGGSGTRKKAAKPSPSRGGGPRPALKPAPGGFEGDTGSMPVDEPAVNIDRPISRPSSKKRAKPPFRDHFPDPGFEAVGEDRIEAVPTATPPAPTLAPETERQINIWIGDGQQRFKRELQIGQTYTLNFKVGSPVEESFTSGPEAQVPSSDIPAGGLPSQWRVIAHDAELAKGTPDTEVTAAAADGGTSWSGRFDLLIPETGDSAVPQLKVTPLRANPRIDVIITARGEVYRKFKILLTASDNPGATRVDPSRVGDEQIFAPATELGLRTTHEWTTPNGVLDLNVTEGPKVLATGLIDGNDIDLPGEPWGAQSYVDGPSGDVRRALEQLRIDWEDHFDNIDPADLADRLNRWNKKPTYWGVPDPDWSKLSFHADPAHEQRWTEMASSKGLRDLAYHGKRLFDAFFPKYGRLRAIVAALPLGARLNIRWTPSAGAGFISHVPWGLMYVADLNGKPVDPMGFLGLRCRIAYTSHQVPSSSRSLGAFDDTHRAHFMYWGDDAKDMTGQEARWQRDQWSGWKNQTFIPSKPMNAKTELLRLLNNPEPAPTSVLYLFCQSSVDAGNSPALQFGSTNDPADMVVQTDFGTAALADGPLVFANACDTAGTGTYRANEFEMNFFERECRAYLGTETKVPIVLGSRFATIFFHFFYRKLDPAPMAAGEAVTQTRLFLWTHYRNIGGLFYCYVNKYDLYVADKNEVLSLRR